MFIHRVGPPAASTTPMRTDAFVWPAFGYGYLVMDGYSASV